MTKPTLRPRTGTKGTTPTPRATARVVGTPGHTTRSQYRQAVAAYRRLPTKWALGAALLTTALAAAAANSIGISPIPAAVATIATLIVINVAVRRPDAAATTLVIVLATAAARPFVTLYAAAATNGSVDQGGATATLLATLAVTGLVAHRASRGRPWVTTLIVAAAIMFVGPWLLLLAPTAGFAWAWAVATAVLVLRCGGLAWTRDQIADIRDAQARLRRRGNTALPDDLQDLTRKAVAETATGELLATLPATYTVFHDRQLPTGQHLDHLLIGPTGVHLLTSLRFTGRVTEDPEHGLTHPTVPIAALLNTADATAAAARARLKPRTTRALRIHPVVVLHDAVLPVSTAQVALSTGNANLGTVTITSPAHLLEYLTAHADTPLLSDREVARLVARADRVFRPARPTNAPPQTPGPDLRCTVVAADGEPLTDPPATAEPLFVSSHSQTTFTPGETVTVLTDQGAFTGYRVTGEPTVHDDGILYVPLDSHPTGALRTTGWFPLDSVEPATAHR